MIIGSTNVWADDVTATLSGTAMLEGNSPSTSYADHNTGITDDDDNTYVGRWTYAKYSSTYLQMIQIKALESSNSSRIQLPQFGGNIKSISITATNANSNTSSGTGAKTKLIIVKGTTYTKTFAQTTANQVLTDGDKSTEHTSYSFDFTGLDESYDGSGLYICSNDAAIRIWSIVVVYTPKTASSVGFANATPSIGYPATSTYQQIATTAAGYDGTVTYALSENSCGASISGSTVTVTQQGSVKVTATAPATSTYAQSTASYILTVTDSRTDNGLAFPSASQEVAVGDILSAPTLTNPNNLVVTYSSGDEDIAMVDEDTGDVMGVAIGSTTITATYAGSETYKSGSVSYTINVKRAVPNGQVFYESVSGYTGSSDESMTTSSSYLDSEDWDTFTQVYTGKTGGFKLGSSNNTAVLKTKALALKGSGTLTYSVQRYDGSNAGSLSVDVTGATATGDISNIAGTADWVEKTVNLTNATGSVVITFTTNSSSKRIRLDDIVLVATEVETTVSSAGWATYVPAYDVEFPASTAYIVTGESEGNTQTTEVTEVPAMTPVLLKGAGDKTATVMATKASSVGTNYLKVSDGTIVGDDTNIYVLANKSQGVGFYLWDSTAAAIPSGKVYLDLTGSGAKGVQFISFDEAEEPSGEATAIASVETLKNAEVIYNLAGQRVGKDYKGIVIVNGKKMLNK